MHPPTMLLYLCFWMMIVWFTSICGLKRVLSISQAQSFHSDVLKKFDLIKCVNLQYSYWRRLFLLTGFCPASFSRCGWDGHAMPDSYMLRQLRSGKDLNPTTLEVENLLDRKGKKHPKVILSFFFLTVSRKRIRLQKH